MSGTLSHHLKRDEVVLKTTIQHLLFSSGMLLVWLLLLVGIALSIVLLKS